MTDGILDVVVDLSVVEIVSLMSPHGNLLKALECVINLKEKYRK